MTVAPVDFTTTSRFAKGLHYHEAGPASAAATPVVMLHGGGPGASAGSNFGRNLGVFADQFRTLAVDLLFENSGGRALKTGTPIQRFWRDAHAGRVHAINDPERALSAFGRGEFGLEVPPDAML